MQLAPLAVEDFTSGTLKSTPSSIHSAGVSALFASALLAAAGLGMRMFSFVKAPQSLLRPVEMLSVEDIVMAATTAEKRASKKAMKKKPKKRSEKKERVEVVYTPQEVMKRMHAGAVRKNANLPKDAKTTGRVCQLLGKVDNRQARSISFSHRRIKRIQMVNLHWRRLWWEEGNVYVTLRLSTKGIKTVTRYGLQAAAIKFGLDLTKFVTGTSERKYIKHLPEKEKKFAMMRGAKLRYKSAVRWARLNDEEVPAPPKGLWVKSGIPKPKKTESIAMAVSHGVKMARLGRPQDQRRALLRNLTTELIRHGRIKTTLTKAKALRKFVDHMITLAKDGSLHARRQAASYLYDKTLVKTLFEQVPDRYGSRDGGYTRIMRVAHLRQGDAAPMCVIELV